MATLLDQTTTALRTHPAPTNAQALALLSAFGGLPLSPSDLDVQAPRVARLRYLAHGYSKPGDKFRGAKNRAWYARRFADPNDLAVVLRDVAVLADDEYQRLGDRQPVIVMDRELAAGEESAIAHELLTSWRMLQDERAVLGRPGNIPTLDDIRQGIDKALPVIKPIVDAPGRLARALRMKALVTVGAVVLGLYLLNRRRS